MDFCSVCTDSRLLSALVLGVNGSFSGTILRGCTHFLFLFNILFLAFSNCCCEVVVACSSHEMRRLIGYPLDKNDSTLLFMHWVCADMSEDDTNDLLWYPDRIEMNVSVGWCEL